MNKTIIIDNLSSKYYECNYQTIENNWYLLLITPGKKYNIDENIYIFNLFNNNKSIVNNLAEKSIIHLKLKEKEKYTIVIKDGEDIEIKNND